MKQKMIAGLMATALLAGGLGQIVWAMSDGLPPVQHAGSVSYLSGGVGADASGAIKAQIPKYPMVLEFAGSAQGANEYLSDVPVTITDVHGRAVQDTSARGPFLLVSAQPGRYSVAATYQGKAEHRAITATPHGHVHELFLWRGWAFKKRVPDLPPRLNEVLRLIARLGGFLPGGGAPRMRATAKVADRCS